MYIFFLQSRFEHAQSSNGNSWEVDNLLVDLRSGTLQNELSNINQNTYPRYIYSNCRHTCSVLNVAILLNRT